MSAAKRQSGSFVILAVLITFAVGCNAILGIKDHQLSPDGGGGAGTAGTAGATGTGGAAGTAGSSLCVDGAVNDAEQMDAAAEMACGFPMPNPAGTGLPNPASYRMNTVDGSVTDLVTGLTWEGKSRFTVYMYGEARTPCDEKSGGGWRLPTRVELASLVDFTIAKPGPTINAIFASDPIWASATLPTDMRFWTSSHAACDASVGWYVDFANGSTHQENDASVAYKVRCVTGTPTSCPTTRYQVNADGVLDGFTGLTWQKDVGPQQMWSAARTYCPSGWRLPSVTEIQSIVLERNQNPSIDTNVFAGTPSMGYFWTSSPAAGDPNSAWYLTFIHGHTNPQSVGTPYWVRCVTP